MNYGLLSALYERQYRRTCLFLFSQVFCRHMQVLGVPYSRTDFLFLFSESIISLFGSIKYGMTPASTCVISSGRINKNTEKKVLRNWYLTVFIPHEYIPYSEIERLGKGS